MTIQSHTELAALLPCPFCGHDTPEFERLGTPRLSCIVICGNCGARHESSDEGAHCGSSWNTRAALESPTTPERVQAGGVPAEWLSKFEELLEDYAGARAEVAFFNATQRSGVTVRLPRPRLKALMGHIESLAATPPPQAATAGAVDRGDAVNLASNLLCGDVGPPTPRGVQVLCEAVMSMDAALRASTPAERVPLTNEQHRAIWERESLDWAEGRNDNPYLAYGQAIEAAHGIVTKESST